MGHRQCRVSRSRPCEWNTGPVDRVSQLPPSVGRRPLADDTTTVDHSFVKPQNGPRLGLRFRKEWTGMDSARAGDGLRSPAITAQQVHEVDPVAVEEIWPPPQPDDGER